MKKVDKEIKFTGKEKIQRALLILSIIIFLILVIVVPGNILLIITLILCLFSVFLRLKYPNNERMFKTYIFGYLLLFISFIMICCYVYNIIDFFNGGSVSNEYIITDITRGKSGGITSIEVENIETGEIDTLYSQFLSKGKINIKLDNEVHINSTPIKNIVNIKK